ncbi:MAG: hypothetical protein V1909_04025 [Candidatus Micrarchaeota archaeon]
MRGQIATIDAIFSTIVLLLLALTIITFLNSETLNTESLALDEKRDALAFAAIQQLALTIGRPENWNATNCERIGLSCGEGELCADKISFLSSMYASNYSQTKKLIGLGAYDVSILICPTNNYANCNYNISNQARELDRANSSHVSRAEAISTLNQGTVSVIVYAWE